MSDERLTLEEASHRLGVSLHTVRRRVRSGSLRGIQEPTQSGFRWLVVLDSDAPTDSPEAEQPPDTVLTQVLEHVQGERDRLVRQVEEQAATIRRQEDRIDRLTTEKQETIDRLTVLLQQAQQGRQSLLTQTSPMDTQPVTQTATQAATRHRPRSLWIRLLDALRGP